ncbi:hypothetical protein ACQZ40_01925 [Agrobacterium sp. 16-172Ci]
MINPNDIDQFKDFHQLTEGEAEASQEVLDDAMNGVGDGKTVADSGRINDPVGMTRRHVLAQVLGALSVSGNIASVASFALEAYGHDTAPPPQISPNFISRIHEKREGDGLNDIVPSSNDEANFLRYLLHFRSGRNLNEGKFEELRKMRRAAQDTSVKVMLSDLEASQLSRFGVVLEAKALFEEIAFDSVGLDADRVVLTEKSLVNAYSTVRWSNVLEPEKWKFEEGLRRAADVGVNQYGIYITEVQGSPINVSIPNGVTIPTKGILSGVKGFYIINWILHYWSASNPKEARDCADLQYAVLKIYARDVRFHRQVGITAYMIGLHYHRLSVANDNSQTLRRLAIQFFRICTDGIGGEWSPLASRLRADGLRGDDINAIYALIFFNTFTDVAEELGLRGIAKHIDLQPKLVETTPYLIKRFADRHRFVRSETAPFRAAHLLYTDNNPSLQMHLPRIEDYQKSLRAS